MSSPLAAWLAEVAKARGLSQYELRRRLGRNGVNLTQQAVSRWFRGETYPRRDAWPRVLDLLALSGEERAYANALFAGDVGDDDAPGR